MPDVLMGVTYALEALVVLSGLLAVGAWWATFRLKKRLTGLLVRWDKPAFGLWTAVIFLFVLIFLSAGMLSYAFSIRLFPGSFSAPLWRDIASLCFLEVSVLILLFAGLRAHHLHVLSDRGVYLIKFNWSRLEWMVELVPWEEVYDYYHHEEGGLARYVLLLRDRRQVVLEVPMPLREIIDRVILLSTEKYSFLHKYGPMIRRHHPES
ncbi:MAG: hypothetical protein N3E49_07345 [Bacteroidia bacterium]|nr:hypothetical protein [Bacteroidia bacterium]